MTGLATIRLADRVFRVDEARLLPVLEQLDVPLAPCPPGWSRWDIIFGDGDDCAVPTKLRNASVVLYFITGIVLFAHLQHELVLKRSRGLTRTSMYRALTACCNCMFLSLLWSVCALLLPSGDIKLMMVFLVAVPSMAIDYIILTSSAFITNAFSTVYALETEKAAVWHGRVAVVWEWARPALVAGLCYAGSCIVAGSSVGDFSMVHRGIIVHSGVLTCMFGLAGGLMAAAAAGTGRAARALGGSADSTQLRRKLQRQRRAAIVLEIGYLCTALCGLIAVYSKARRSYSIFFFLESAVMALFAVAGTVLNRRARKQRQKRVAVTENVTERRISTAVEAPASSSSTHAAVGRAARVPLARRGVSLAFLRGFAEQKRVGVRMTTGEVCSALVKPATEGEQCSYYDLLHRSDVEYAAATLATSVSEASGGTSEGTARGRSPRAFHASRWTASSAAPASLAPRSVRWAGESDYFLSHTWSYRFRELLAIIEAFEEQAKPDQTLYYWFDIFVMNQHNQEDLGQVRLLHNLADSIQGPGRVLLALDSWRDPSPLSRVWCLLEIFTAMEQGAELVMCLSSAEQASLAEKLVKNQAEVHRVLEAVDAEKAEATVASDREAIFALIRGKVGFGLFNSTITEALRQSFARVVIAQRRL